VTGPDLTDEIYTTPERLGARCRTPVRHQRWRDTLDDAEVLALLCRYNATGRRCARSGTQ
jgi:hypothetical protein